LRFVDCTFTVDALPDSGMERKVRRDDFWSWFYDSVSAEIYGQKLFLLNLSS
jgi:hypothetical protein